MRHRFNHVLARSACILASLVLTVGVIPGCGEGPSPEQAGGGPPPVLKESNDNMENFMKNKSAKSAPASKPAPAEEAPKS